MGRIAKHGHPIRIIADDRTVALVPEDDTLETKVGRIVEYVSPTGEANARLIATAPELLEALISAERALRQALDPEFEGALRPGGFAYDDARKTLGVVRAAIAKVNQ